MASALVLATILIGLIPSTSAYDFYVGGRDGWVQNPKESYNNWASRMRFQVNDKLGNQILYSKFMILLSICNMLMIRMQMNFFDSIQV